VAFGSLAVAALWVHSVEDLFLQLAVCEVAVVAWYTLRSREPAGVASPPVTATVESPSGLRTKQPVD